MVQPYNSEGILVIFSLILLPLLCLIFRKFKSQSPHLPPGPTSWPIIGTIHLMKPITHISLANLAQVHGPLMLLRLGSQLLIVGSSASAAEEILKVNDKILSARSVPHSVPLAKNDISFWYDSVSDHWKYIRTVCRTELFSSRALEGWSGVMEYKVVQMVQWLRSKEGLEVNVQQMVFATVINMFGNVFLSKDIVALEKGSGCDQVKGFLRGMIEAISAQNLCDFYPFLGKFDLHGLRKKYKEMSMGMWGLWEAVVRDRRRTDREEHSSQDFLDYLISEGLTDDQINKVLEELFVAGIHTTASTIIRTMMELASSPESLTRLVCELDAVFDQDPFKNFHLEKLPYLQACIKETLRLHPPAPMLLSHCARYTCQVMNYTIPKNARVLVNVWMIGRDPMVWEKPYEYRPERFINSARDFKGNDFEFLPFGSGRRICPGLPMAAKIMPLVVALLTYSFNWSSPHGIHGIVDETFRATSSITEPLVLIPRVRVRLA